MDEQGAGGSVQCPQCETATSEDARVCRSCGHALTPQRRDEGAATTGSQAAEQPRPEQRTAAAPATEPVAAGRGGVGGDDGHRLHREDDVVTAVVAGSPVEPRGREPRGPGEEQAEQRACPSCGAPNVPRRELCGRCGVDLETGVSLPRPLDVPADPERVATRRPEERRRWRGWRLLLAVPVVIALILGGLTLAGLGPLAGAPPMPDAEFDPAAYPDDADALRLSDVATRTTAGSIDGDHAPHQMADLDPASAWHSDGSVHEHGVGEVIDLFLQEPAWVQRIVINNGDHSDSDAYAQHARIRRAEVTFDGHEGFVIRLDDLGLQAQAIELPEPVLTTTVRIVVTETFEGDLDPSLAVSDIGLDGHPARDGDLEVARERAEVARATPPTQ